MISLSPKFKRIFILSLTGVALCVSPIAEHNSVQASEVSTNKTKKTTRKTTKKTKKSSKPAIQVLFSDPETGEWIHKGNSGIIIHKDTIGVVRGMSPFTGPGTGAESYAAAINRYGDYFADTDSNVRVYSLLAPTQGEYYMPEQVSTIGAERRAIDRTSSFFNGSVTPIIIGDTLQNHIDEEIYSRTDHHWSPLGAFYAASAVAEAAGVDFLPIDVYEENVVYEYVGTMYKFSGDKEIQECPEDFVYFVPPMSYDAEFINYTIKNQKTMGENEPHPEEFFKKYPDGSSAAYLTFMGGDYSTVKVSGTGGTPGRRVLIVKDSYGNAMASCLFGSFEEVHVIDFRYFPHNLRDYVEKNGITDLVFENCVQLAFAPATAERLNIMYESTK